MRVALQPPAFFLSSQNSDTLISVQSTSAKSKYEVTSYEVQGDPMIDFGWRMAQVGRRIYIIGGNADPHRFVELTYQCATDDFTPKSRAPMSSPRCMHSVCSSSKNSQKLYVSGGTAGDSSVCSDQVSQYDACNDVWMALPQLTQARHSHASCASKQGIFVFCGLSVDD